MELRERLEGLDRSILVEVVYLCGRYLIHGLSPEKFLRQLDLDVKTHYAKQSAEIVIAIMKDFEEKEGSPISEMPMGRRFDYAANLDEELWKRINSGETISVEQTLAQLRKQ